MKRLIIADTGPLIIFAKSKKLQLLRDMAAQILVTTTVMHECIDDSGKPGAAIISKAFEDFTLSQVADVELSDELRNIPLDAGELSTIALAISMNDPDLFILVDEVLGRGVAHKHGLKVIGSAGILLAAKQAGLIIAVEPIIREWQKLGYFLKESLVNRLLIEAGEGENYLPPYQ